MYNYHNKCIMDTATQKSYSRKSLADQMYRYLQKMYSHRQKMYSHPQARPHRDLCRNSHFGVKNQQRSYFTAFDRSTRLRRSQQRSSLLPVVYRSHNQLLRISSRLPLIGYINYSCHILVRCSHNRKQTRQ